MYLGNALLLVLVSIGPYALEGSRLETIRYCCGLGKNYADSGLKCESFQTPIAGIGVEDERFCLSSVKACCKSQYRERQCEEGKLDAHGGTSCAAGESEEKKSCCEACKIGLEAAAESSPCDIALELGPLMDAAVKACCEEATSSTVPITTISTTTTTTAAIPSLTSEISTTDTSRSSEDVPENYSRYGKSTPPPSSAEGACEFMDLCAHNCIKTGDSYRCECNEGYILMADGVSCKRDTRVKDRCALHNPCDHQCLDTGVAIKCMCDEGYKLAKDKRTCHDIDECALGIHDCGPGERCVNIEGEYECENINNSYSLDKNDFPDKCPEGYIFNSEKMVCDDIDECEVQLVCPDRGSCINTIGSYECREVTAPACPPGFQFKDSIQTCADIDECVTGQNNCDPDRQVCLNNKGNYTCMDKSSMQTCPPGFKKNPYTQLCEDVNECLEIPDVCKEDEDCENEPGGHNCVPKIYPYTRSTSNGYTTSIGSTTPETQRTTVTITSTSTTTTTTEIPSTSTTETSRPSYPNHSTSSVTPNYPRRSSNEPVQPPLPPRGNFPTPEEPPRRYPPWMQPNYFSQGSSCQAGYRLSADNRGCVDINECVEDELGCDSNQNCYNTQGGFICTCKQGFQEDTYTGACVDINECQIGQDNCGEGQRCDNTIGSFFCARVAGCGTGYTLNTATGLCEDDNECSLGTHNCQILGPRFVCRNTPGSYRCILSARSFAFTTPATPVRPYPNNVPTIPPSARPNIPVNTPSVSIPARPTQECLPGHRMSPRGRCEDIDECESSPCQRGEKCINLQNRYQCIPQIQCRNGFELNEDGNECEDINECARGLHKCKASQICKNGPGYYLCQCPAGHKLNANNECEDIDECEYYRGRICSSNAICQNTVGSYKCICKDGFKENEQGCEDVDECGETPNLCHHKCVNMWGSYRCACERGFILNSDNRTCGDIDECEQFKDRKLCIGTCQNVPGSYTCKCPEGYRLGSDGRTCQDIDECERDPCPSPDDICFNIRGGYRCHSIQCPPRYIRDPEHRSHCKRASNICDINDYNCVHMPKQYSYHFVTFVSNLPIPQNAGVDFFQMKGPTWLGASSDVTMTLKNVRCPRHVQKADENYFQMIKTYNRVVLAVVKPIQGPQDIELQLQMQLFVNDVFQGKLISTIFIIVTEYPF